MEARRGDMGLVFGFRCSSNGGMDVTRLSSRELVAYIALLEQRLEVLRQIERVNAQLTRVEHTLGRPSLLRPIKVRLKKKENRRPLAGPILNALQQAGANGLKVSQIAKAINRPARNIAIWLATTGKKLKTLRKLRRGHYMHLHQAQTSPA